MTVSRDLRFRIRCLQFGVAHFETCSMSILYIKTNRTATHFDPWWNSRLIVEKAPSWGVFAETLQDGLSRPAFENSMPWIWSRPLRDVFDVNLLYAKTNRTTTHFDTWPDPAYYPGNRNREILKYLTYDLNGGLSPLDLRGMNSGQHIPWIKVVLLPSGGKSSSKN